MDIEPPAGDFLLQQDRKTELLGFVLIYGPNGCVSGFIASGAGGQSQVQTQVGQSNNRVTRLRLFVEELQKPEVNLPQSPEISILPPQEYFPIQCLANLQGGILLYG